MTTKIKVWQINDDDKLVPIKTCMAESGRDEPHDLQTWISNNPELLGDDLLIIGEQVETISGYMDFLAVDSSGNTVIVELKRDLIPREALAQAIDYASDVVNWDYDRLNDICKEYYEGEPELADLFAEQFELRETETVFFNEKQRILLVGCSITEPLERMIEWLSVNYDVSINAILFRYIKTQSGEELIAKTTIIPEEVDQERSRSRRTTRISDEPGNYDEDELEKLLTDYFSQDDLKTPGRIRTILLPLCLEHEIVDREMIKRKLLNEDEEIQDIVQANGALSNISRAIGFENNDFLRQIIGYDKIDGMIKDNYRVPNEYKELVKKIIHSLDPNSN